MRVLGSCESPDEGCHSAAVGGDWGGHLGTLQGLGTEATSTRDSLGGFQRPVRSSHSLAKDRSPWEHSGTDPV